MGKVPQTYYDFVMDYAPYVYVIPGSGPDLTWGRAVFASAFAINFLYQAYFAKQFENSKNDILNKIVELADFILAQQCTDLTKKAYGGFKSNENSTYYYSIDACRAIPSLLQAYKLTNNVDYLNSAKLAGQVFLKTMQDQQTYGGFARAVDFDDNWLLELDVECLYGLIGLRMLCSYDSESKSLYESMMKKAADFLCEGLENLWLYYSPSDGKWHRIGLNENEIYDDSFAYALLGLYDYEGWSQTVERVYNLINSIRACAEYPAYNPAICWAGYIDVVKRFPACGYYDAVTAGILWKIRKYHDKSSFEFAMKIVEKHAEDFMFWGVKFDDYSPVENKQAMATVCWLAQFFLNYSESVTPYTRILQVYGENVLLYPVREASSTIYYGEAIPIKAIVQPARIEEMVIEPGYAITDYITLYTFAPIRPRDKIERKGVEYEVSSVQEFSFKSELMYRTAICRRLLGQ